MRFRRRNFLYSLSPERLTAAAAAVAGVIKEKVRELTESDVWPGFESVRPPRGETPAKIAV